MNYPLQAYAKELLSYPAAACKQSIGVVHGLVLILYRVITDALLSFEIPEGGMLSCVFVPSGGDQSKWTPLKASIKYKDRLVAMQTDNIRMRIDFEEQ